MSDQAETIAHALTTGLCDFGFLHVKAVDDTGHDRATALKVTVFEAESSPAAPLTAMHIAQFPLHS